MRARRIVLLCLSVLFVCVIAGCGGGAKGPNDVKLVAQHYGVVALKVPIAKGLRKKFAHYAADKDVPAEIKEAFASWGKEPLYGSGFVLNESPKGRTWIMTTGELAAFGDGAFVSVDGATDWKWAQLVYFDQAHGLAVLDLDGAGHPPGLSLAADAQPDQPVVTAGFSALNINGATARAFQQGSSRISQRCVKVEELGMRDDVCFIEHGAAIDAGTLGGPLLDAQGRVIGVNYALVRSNKDGPTTSLAIPIWNVRRAVELADVAFAKTDTTVALQAMLEHSCRTFADEMRTSQPRYSWLETYIGHDLIVERGASELVERAEYLAEVAALEKNPRTERAIEVATKGLDNLSSGFAQASLSAMRQMLLLDANELIEKAGGIKGDQPCMLMSPTEDITGAKDVRIEIQTGYGHVTSTWCWDRGTWRICSL